MWLEKPSPASVSTVPPATEPVAGATERSTGGVVSVAPSASVGAWPPASVASVIVWVAVDSSGGRVQVSTTAVCIAAVQLATGHAGASKEVSTAAVSTSHSVVPSMRIAFSDGVSESVWPVTVSVSPSLAVAGEVEMRTGVSESA